jgi:hypothetical protein
MTCGTVKAEGTSQKSPRQAHGEFFYGQHSPSKPASKTKPNSENESSAGVPREVESSGTTPPVSPPYTVIAAPPESDFNYVMPRHVVWKRAFNRRMTTLKESISEFYKKNIGLVMVFFAQMFASIVGLHACITAVEEVLLESLTPLNIRWPLQLVFSRLVLRPSFTLFKSSLSE